MLNKQSNCSRKLNEYLGELARREDLELLRAPLRDNDLFPADKDPASAAITMEELKKLVRCWKLHEARGFWKMHPTKEDLVSALLEFMEDKEEYTRMGPQRPASSKPSREPPRQRPGRQQQQAVDLATFKVTVFKPYAGDLFSQQDHTMGLIYLSRQNLRNNPKNTGFSGGGKQSAGGAVKASPRARGGQASFLSGDFFPGVQLAGSTSSMGALANMANPEEADATERQKERWLAIILEIFRYSCLPGDEVAILDEGCLAVIDKIAKTEVVASSLAAPAMAACCAATIANLAVAPATHARLMPPSTLVVIETLNGIASHHGSDPHVHVYCALALAHLSCPFGLEDPLVAMCLSTLAAAANTTSGDHPSLAALEVDCKKIALTALSNLLVSPERNQVVEHMLPPIKVLAAKATTHSAAAAADDDLLLLEDPATTTTFDVDAALIVLCAAYNLSFYDYPRTVMIEGGAVGALLNVLGRLFPRAKEEEEEEAAAVDKKKEPLGGGAVTVDGVAFDVVGGGADRDALIHTFAEVFLNLTCSVDAREKVIRDGLVTGLVQLERLAHKASTREVLALALSNATGADLAAVAKAAVDEGIVGALVSLVMGREEEFFPSFKAEARLRLAAALCNLTVEADAQRTMVAQGAHSALMRLSNAEAPEGPVQPFVLVAAINLLRVADNQRPMVDAGLMPVLHKLCAVSADLAQLCGSALANIADDLGLHTEQTHVDVLEMMGKLAGRNKGVSSDVRSSPSSPTMSISRSSASLAAARKDHESAVGLDLLRIVSNAFACFSHIMTTTTTTTTQSPSGEEQEQEQSSSSAAAAAARSVAVVAPRGLVTEEVVATIVSLCASEDTDVLRFAGVALNNLSQVDAFHDRLIACGVVDACRGLSKSKDDEVRRLCASTVRSLTSSPGFAARVSTTHLVGGFVKVLRSLEASRAPDIINASAAALFAVSCASDQLLECDRTILWRLFGMMRGGEEATQLYAARALCNLTAVEATVTMLLKERAIADFIAIAILRTNNEDVKGVCAECLFNILRYETSRPALLKEPNNVLWAISRLFRSVESTSETQQTQRIGGLVVYNLSCEPATAAVLMDTINAAETLSSVAATPGREPTTWAAAALCNLSWNPDFAAKLVFDAAKHRPGAGHPGGQLNDSEFVGRGIVRIIHCLLNATTLGGGGRTTTSRTPGQNQINKTPSQLSDDALQGEEEEEVTAAAAAEAKTRGETCTDPAVRLMCAKALYNMTRVSGDVSERLVDDNAIMLLEYLLDFMGNATQDVVVELACLVFYNISAVPGCEAAMVDFQAQQSLMKLLKKIIHGDAMAAATAGGSVPVDEDEDQKALEKRNKKQQQQLILRRQQQQQQQQGPAGDATKALRASRTSVDEDLVLEDESEDERQAAWLSQAFPVAPFDAQEAAPVALLVMATFYNLSSKVENRANLFSAGVADACVAIAALETKASEAVTMLALHRLAIRVLQNLSYMTEAHKTLATQRLDKVRPLLKALATWGRLVAAGQQGKDDDDDEEEEEEEEDMLFEVASVLANLSGTAALVKRLVQGGAVRVLVDLTRLAADRASLNKKGFDGRWTERMLATLALAARNLSPSGRFVREARSAVDPSWLGKDVVAMLRVLSRLEHAERMDDDDPARPRLEDCAAVLYNLLIAGGNWLHHGDDLLALLTALFKKCDQNPVTRTLCAAALIARQAPAGAADLLLLTDGPGPLEEEDSQKNRHTPKKAAAHYSDGSVVALHSAMTTEIGSLDANAVAAPRKLKPDKRDLSAALGARDLGTIFDRSPHSAVLASRSVNQSNPEPQWIRFEQRATASFSSTTTALANNNNAAAPAALKLPKQSGEPPKSHHAKTSGRFRKLVLKPTKVRPQQQARLLAAAAAASPLSPHSAPGHDATLGFGQIDLVYDMRAVYAPIPN